MTNTKKANCNNCCPGAGAVNLFTKTFSFEADGFVWECNNCYAQKPVRKSAKQSWEFITEEAKTIREVRSNKDKVSFMYFNPNGGYATKNKTDEKVSAAVDAGQCKSGALFVHGSLNDFAYNKMDELNKAKRPALNDILYVSGMFHEDAAKAEKFIAGLEG